MKPRCQVLDDDGEQCENISIAQVETFFDREMYDVRQWGLVHLCGEHLERWEREELEEANEV